MPHDLYTVQGGKLALHLHWGQWQAWEARQRWVLVLAGTQSGKTSFGPLWLWREIQQRGAGDYLVVTPSFPLLELKALPEFRRLFEQLLGLGRYVGGPVRKFVFSPDGAERTYGSRTPSTVYFGHAQDPESLESATAKAAWLDEAGQKKFKLGSWQAIRRRLSLHEGRALLTTTPYDLGWLKQHLYDKAQKGDASIAVINFASTMNPAFPAAEFASARASLPPWQFRMMYMGLFERPAGLIYDSFNPATHTVPRFAIPDAWPRYLGLDFGGVHTAGLFYAAEPGTRRLYAYREYLAGGRTAVEHTAKLLDGEPGIPTTVGGSKSEDQWRAEFRAGGTVAGAAIPGLPVREPAVSDVEVGIQRVYGTHKRGELFVFDDLAGYLDEKATYSRVLDANGEPTEEIEDKSTYHLLDAERYILGWLRPLEAATRHTRYPF
jgi:hypothetical protein